jgi:FAD/FMN-containing dehydrogenase
LGDCHLHFHLIYSKEQQEIVENIYDNIVKESSRLGGVYSAEHGTGKRKRNDFIECYGIRAVNQIKLCKRAFDSKMLLNQGNIIK